MMNDSEYNQQIDNVSKFLWDKIKEISNRNNCEIDIPIVITKEIDNISNICCHINLLKRNRNVQGSFYIHSQFSHSHCLNTNQENSLHVNKDMYFNYVFFSSKMILADFNNDVFYENFKNSIYNLFKNILKNLKFNTFFGKFEIGKNEHDDFYQSLFNILNVNENVKTIGDKCCVCHEQTATETDCNHSLCVKCYMQIKKMNHSDSKCPLCRQFI